MDDGTKSQKKTMRLGAIIFRLSAFVSLMILLLQPLPTGKRQPLIALRESHGYATESETASPKGNGKLHIMVSCLWEGRHIQSFNTDAIAVFREEFKSMPLLHFVDPAYLLRGEALRKRATDALKTLIREGDHVGLHLAPWKSVLATAKVILRREPTFWGYALSDKDCAEDCGGDIPLSVYREEEIDRIVQAALRTLKSNHIGEPRSFIAAGWIASKPIMEAAARNQLTMDFSGVAPMLVQPTLGRYPLYPWLRDLWATRTPFSQPSVIATRSRAILEFGNVAATVDHSSLQELESLFMAYTGIWKREPKKDLYFHFGFYQETAEEMLPLVKAALQRFFEIAQQKSVPVDLFVPPMSDPRYDSAKWSAQ